MARDRHNWLDNFAFVIEADELRRLRRNPEYDAFTGSKWLALPWLILVAAIAGAFGGLAVSAALWSVWWQVLALPFGLLAFFMAAYSVTLRLSGRAIAGLVGWVTFFGVLIGIFTMWAAQTASSGWAYAIAGGLTFILLGITGAQLSPPNSKTSEEWFLTGSIAAPAGACLATWLFRNVLSDPGTLGSAAMMGALAATIFLGTAATLYMVTWRPARGLRNLAKLKLHSDRTAAEAVNVLGPAIREAPEDGELHALRGLARGLAGDDAGSAQDFARAHELSPKSAAECSGWLALRRDDPTGALEAFVAAGGGVMAIAGLGLAQLRLGESGAALATLKRLRTDDHDELSLTYLAEAQLASGDAAAAVGTASDAIDELESTHGRSWLVRAEAYRALGDIDAAAKDYNLALAAADEVGIRRSALAGLEAIGRPLTDDD
jgi:tetratricopeptide (TPR) repeat protein